MGFSSKCPMRSILVLRWPSISRSLIPSGDATPTAPWECALPLQHRGFLPSTATILSGLFVNKRIFTRSKSTNMAVAIEEERPSAGCRNIKLAWTVSAPKSCGCKPSTFPKANATTFLSPSYARHPVSISPMMRPASSNCSPQSQRADHAVSPV